MEKYIIQYTQKTEEGYKTLFHQNIAPCTNNQVMNVYIEEMTSDKKKAKVFYDEEEAAGVCNMFRRTNVNIGTVIIKTK